MFAISDAFKDILKSNIRPKSEPKITVKGQDNEGNQVVLTWTASTIRDLNYKRGIDPIGRTLPFMELSWTEIYTGKFNAENYPDKYKNIKEYMTVEFSVTQNLGFFNSWKTIYNEGKSTWKDILEAFKTWKNVAKSVKTETINFPTLYLVGKPDVQGQTITWAARDFMSFLNTQNSDGFRKDINYVNPARRFLLDERANFLSSDDLIDAIMSTDEEIASTNLGLLENNIVFDEQTKNILMNYFSVKNYYWDFVENKATLHSLNEMFNKNQTEFWFKGNIMHSFPELTKNKNISAYSYNQYVVEETSGESYSVSPVYSIDLNGTTINRFVFKDFGIPSADNGFVAGNICKSTYSNATELNVAPVNYNGIGVVVQTKNSGEVFNEDNPCNIYSAESDTTTERLNCLKKYFNSECYSMSFSSLGVLPLETNDLVSVETNLYEGENRITKNGIVVEIDISYNGAFKQNTIVHEVKNDVWI